MSNSESIVPAGRLPRPGIVLSITIGCQRHAWRRFGCRRGYDRARNSDGTVILCSESAPSQTLDSSLRVEASLQLSIYSYSAAMSPLGGGRDVRLRFDVLTKTKELHRYPTTRDRRANIRLFRLASELLRAIESGVFYPNVGWQCRDCVFRSQCWAWR